MANHENDLELEEALSVIEPSAFLDAEGVDYKRTYGTRGEQLNLKTCPVCGGSKWKVYVNADSGLGNCFHGDCETKFNKFTLIKAHSGLFGRQLIDYIKQTGREMGWAPRKRVVNSAPVIIKAELHLPESFELPYKGRNVKYLEDRGIDAVMAKYFNLRFCEDGYFEYPTPEGKNAKQNYSNRIIIPIFDLNGTFVSFQGRDITGTADKKYLFPPGFAATGSHLYNGHNVIPGTNRVLVGEGAFDVIAQKIALDGDSSFRDIVPIGTFGKHLSAGDTDSQLEKFLMLKARGVKEVTFMWDSEKVAISDAVSAGLLLRGMGFIVRIAILPPGKDPNEVPAAVVRQAFYQAETLNKLTAAKILMR